MVREKQKLPEDSVSMTFRAPAALKKTIVEIAAKNRRSVSGMIRLLLESAIRQYEEENSGEDEL